ncbi:hypothetical protein O181_022081 [Austropuccinia psidii MF-1]|uniref:Uncharacterized protein n=1 Tax=Austropuccinia psidii MF-1 TaxID=1389203 RepID=A0A9Q3GWC8_9BASI|nr:hypothetical protein [Austropuccinia psidii MF-1]
MPGELEHAVKCRCSQSCTLEEIENTLQDVRKRTNIGKYYQFKSSSFKEKQPFRVDLKDKPKDEMEEVSKKESTCHNCGSEDHYANNYPKAKKKVYAIEKVPEEESPTEDSESDSMGGPSENNLMMTKTQEKTQIEIQDIQLEAGMPQDSENKNLCKHTQDAQKFLVTPTK